MAAVKAGGRLAQLNGADVAGDRNISVSSIQSQPSAQRLDTLRAMFDAGKLKVHVEKSFPLAQAREAQQAVEHPHRPGEIVLSVN
jgi:NADPH:quinone reductase-like Zn-dependent oxidoreductase